MDTSNVCLVQEIGVIITTEEATETATLTNSSIQIKDTPTVVSQCQQILRAVTPQRAWGLVYANYYQHSLEVPVADKITWKFSALMVAWILLAVFALSVGCEWYLETTIAHTAVGMLVVVGFVGICAVIYYSLEYSKVLITSIT